MARTTAKMWVAVSPKGVMHLDTLSKSKGESIGILCDDTPYPYPDWGQHKKAGWRIRRAEVRLLAQPAQGDSNV